MIDLDWPQHGPLIITVRDPDSSQVAASMNCDFAVPEIAQQPTSSSSWKQIQRTRSPSDLAGISGTTITDTLSLADSALTLHREVFISMEAEVVALRQTLINTGDRQIELHALYPLRCEGPQSLLLNGSGADSWDVCVQKRFKNDAPPISVPASTTGTSKCEETGRPDRGGTGAG